MADNAPTVMELTASIVSAYVRNNSLPSSELPALIRQVHTALTRVSSGYGEVLGNALRPAIPANKSIAPDYIICLEDRKIQCTSQIHNNRVERRKKNKIPTGAPCAPITTSHRSSIARSGVSAAT